MRVHRWLVCVIFSLGMASVSYAAPVLESLQGGKIPFSSLRGQWVFINYWASWCQPCLEEIPQLNRFYENNKQNQVVVYGVNYDELPLREQQMLIKELGIRYPTLRGNPARALQLGDINTVPVTFVFNPAGKLADVLYGSQTARNLQQAMQAGA